MSGINTTFTKYRVFLAITLGLVILLIISLLILKPSVRKGWLPITQTVSDITGEHDLPPIYFTLDPFTVTLQPEDGDYGAMLYVDLTLRLRDTKTRELFESQLPELRNHLILLLSQQSPSSLTSAEGKQVLLKRIKTELNQKYPNDEQSLFITDVFFNAFIIR